jgi:hypothetical protein
MAHSYGAGACHPSTSPHVKLSPPLTLRLQPGREPRGLQNGRGVHFHACGHSQQRRKSVAKHRALRCGVQALGVALVIADALCISGDGTIPVVMQQRLVEIGDWLKVNGDAIFESTTPARSCQYTQGARPGRQMGLAHSFQVAYRVMDLIGHGPKNGVASIEMFFTAKERDNVTFLYAITVGYPRGTLIIRDVQTSAATQVHMLGLEEELLFDYDGADIHVLVPVMHPSLLPCSYAYTFRVSHAILKDAGHGQPHHDL